MVFTQASYLKVHTRHGHQLRGFELTRGHFCDFSLTSRKFVVKTQKAFTVRSRFPGRYTNVLSAFTGAISDMF